MSNANVAFVKDLYAAFSRGEIDRIVKATHPNCTWEVVGRTSDFPAFGARKGRGEVQVFFDIIAQHISFSEFSPKEFHAVGDKVFVLGRYDATVRKSGRRMASDWIHIFTLRGGEVAAFREFTDTAQLAEAYRG